MVRIPVAAWVLAVLGCCGVADAQVTASVEFCISVANEMSLVAPAGPIQVIHDGTANDQPLGTTLWPCLANDGDGTVVSFATLNAFVHQEFPLIGRDVSLALSIDSSDAGAGWTVTKPTDQTVLLAVPPDLIADVHAESTGPGSATFALDVSFVTGSLPTLAPGMYCTTIVGTITAK